uniref:uncharacterized protein LOC120332612 isoform X2 n=1 Tax=Styela clava TaxID=7725 RepID=UPI00193AABAE|nr:uncharacterized protein LOC120332612 isoform X2 [Styela clava]
MTTRKLELRIDLGDSLPQSPSPPVWKNPRKSGDIVFRVGSNRGRTSRAESSVKTGHRSPYNSVLGPAGSIISGASVVNVDGKANLKRDGVPKISKLLRSREVKKPEVTPSPEPEVTIQPEPELISPREPEVKPKAVITVQRTDLLTPATTTRDNEIEKRVIFTPANTAVTLITPLRGNIDSPLKPYKRQNATAIPKPRPKLRQVHKLPSTAPIMGKREKHGTKKVRIKDKQADNHDAEDKTRGSPTGMAALRELLDAIGKETTNLTFKQMLEVKVAIGMASHVAREVIEDLSSLQSILEELSMLWKINRMDLDLLEHLLQNIGLLEKFASEIAKYKTTVNYDVMPASSERDVTTIIATLHNLLQGSEEATGTYTTMSFSHYGDVYSFGRARLACVKEDLARLLAIHPTQITYLAKVSANNDGYVTVMQMPCIVSKKIVNSARRNHPVLMSLGLKGVQITGSDGLKYTQSMGYLQDKVPAETQTGEAELREAATRSARTAPAGPTLPPLTRKQKSQRRLPHTSMAQHTEIISTPIIQRRNPSQSKHLEKEIITEEDEEHVFPRVDFGEYKREDPSLLPQIDPNEAKFERRVRLARDTLTKLTKPENEELVTVLLDQIQKLHRMISALKKDLREKTRDLNASQSYVQKAQKEIKSMEMRVETKAQQISQTNEHLLKRVKKQMRENAHLRELLEGKDAEIEMHRQSDKENRLAGMIKIARVSKIQTLPHPISFA